MYNDFIKETIKKLERKDKNYFSETITLLKNYIKPIYVNKDDVIKILKQIDDLGGIEEMGKTKKKQIIQDLVSLFPAELVEYYSNDYYSICLRLDNISDEDVYITINSYAEYTSEIFDKIKSIDVEGIEY